VGLIAAFLTLPIQARATCCDVTAVGEAESQIRVCAMSPPGGCQTVLFEGPLAVGESVNVCSETSAVRVERPGATPEEPAAFVTGTACDGNDVEV